MCSLTVSLFLGFLFAAQTTQAEKEPVESPASSKHISFRRSSESPVTKWPRTSDESKLEQVGTGLGLLLDSGEIVCFLK